MASFQAKIGWKRLRKRVEKTIVSFRPYPSRNRNFKNNSKKFKKLKNSFMTLFQAKIGWKRLRKRKNKNYRFVSSSPEP